MAGLGLMLGGILAGLSSTPFAGQGVFPVESFVFALCCLWCFGFGEADEATALQEGDRWPPALAMGALSVILYMLLGNVGAQPVLSILGWALRPFEIVMVGLFAYLWHRALSLPDSYFCHLKPGHMRYLLCTGAGAGLAGLFGGAHADLGRFLILAIGPSPFLLSRMRNPGAPQILAVTLSMALAFLSLSYAFHMSRNRSDLERIQSSLVEMSLHYRELHRPVQEAIESGASEEPEMNYQKAVETLQATLEEISIAAPRLPRPDLQPALLLFSNALASHNRWSTDVFRALDEAHSRAKSSYEEARLAHIRGDGSLTSLQKDLITAYGYVGQDTDRLAGFAFALLAVLTLLGTALVRSQGGGEGSMKVAHLDPDEDDPHHGAGQLGPAREESTHEVGRR